MPFANEVLRLHEKLRYLPQYHDVRTADAFIAKAADILNRFPCGDASPKGKCREVRSYYSQVSSRDLIALFSNLIKF
jgi:hypothetical protein